ncbi:acid protease [Hypoxylon sp. FL1284]|nr:acid protease [Hypoxylon sp. FL1284]
MHRASIAFQLLIWVAGAQALLRHFPRPKAPSSDAVLGERDSKDALGSGPATDIGFVTFKLVQKQPNVKQSRTYRVSRDSKHLATKYGTEAPARSAQGDSSLHSRDNDYNVVTADKPTADNAVGIDQDGTDYSYFLEAGFGSEGKTLYMLVDTGASTTWVMGSGCTSSACTKHNSFGPNDSKTYNDTGKEYSVEYGSGEVSGHVVSDTVNIGGLKVTMPFGVANVTSDQFSQFPFEGILGLSMVSGTWLTYVKDANLIDASVFGIALARNSDGTNDGEIAFGAPNKAKYTGDVSYTPIKSGNSWAIPMDDVLYDGKSASISGRQAYIDTGTTFAFGPPDDVKALYKLVPGSKSTDNGQTYTVPCDSDATVGFSFSGQTWSVSAKDFASAPNGDGTCFGNIYGMEFVPGAWLLGDMFLKNVYSVFDVDQKRIGFAAKAASDSSSTSPTATSTSSGTATPTASSTGSGVGLTPHETSTTNAPGTSAADTGPSSSPTGESSGERVQIGSAYALLFCILSVMGMVI